MAHDFPKPLTGYTGRDVHELWETLWKLIEQLNLNDEVVRDTLARLEGK